MIFLLGGRKNPAIRAIVGAVLLVAGITIHGGAILIGRRGRVRYGASDVGRCARGGAYRQGFSDGR